MNGGPDRSPPGSARELRGGPKIRFSRRKNVFFPMAGMDRSTLISQIKKKETILSMNFLVRLAFLNRDVTPTTEGGDPGATVGEPFKTNKKSIKTNKNQLKSVKMKKTIQIDTNQLKSTKIN